MTGLVGCNSPTVNSVPTPTPQPVATTLRAVASFPFGAALNPNLLNSNAAYRQVASREFNSVTAENYLKMGTVHPAQDRYDWTGSDILVGFAEQNKQRMHGHTLIWHQSLPAWVTNFQGDSLAWENLFKTHIQTVVAHYKDRLASFDVVNEAFSDDGTLRSTIWLTHLGSDYVARAFRYAREANPGVKLFYNEYGHEYSANRLAATVALAADFKRRGIPIDGLGLQMHTNIGQSDVSIENAIQQIATTGLLVHISELDVRVNQARKADYVLTPAIRRHSGKSLRPLCGLTEPGCQRPSNTASLPGTSVTAIAGYLATVAVRISRCSSTIYTLKNPPTTVFWMG
jgi:endo-1,4-beta-xylanase